MYINNVLYCFYSSDTEALEACFRLLHDDDDDSYTDLSPVPVKSAVKSYLTSWLAQNMSKRVLKRLRVLTSTTWLGRLFQILTVRAEK